VSKVAEGANAAVIQPDGKIVVSAGGRAGPLLVRYTGDGRLDRSFAVGGEAVVRLEAPSALSLQHDGRFVVSGWTDAGHRVFAVRRYLPNGSLDASFGRGGEARADFGSHAVLHAATVQANGKIAAAGTRASKDFAVARYTSSGGLDRSFGVGGKVTTDFGSVWATR